MAVNDLWGKMILGDIINHHDRLAQALGLYFATTFDLQRLFYKLLNKSEGEAVQLF